MADDPKPVLLCSVEDCDRKHAANSYCSMHNARVARHGSTDTKPKKARARSEPLCSEDGCGKKVHARGLCAGHYTAWRRAAAKAEERTAAGKPGPRVDTAEYWRPVVGFARYNVSNHGRVWVIPPLGGRGVFVEPSSHPDTGERFIVIRQPNGAPLYAPIASLVRRAFPPACSR